MHVHRLVVIESRFKGEGADDMLRLSDERRNVTITIKACRFACMQGYNPYANHLFFPQFLDDNNPEERELGIRAGLKWSSFAGEAWFVFDRHRGFSTGMEFAHDRHMHDGRKIRYFLYDEKDDTFIEMDRQEVV